MWQIPGEGIMKKIGFILLVALAGLTSPLSSQIAADLPEPLQAVIVSTPPLELLQPQVVLPSLVPELPVSTSGTLKKFEAKYNLQKIGHRGIGGGLNFISRDEETKLGIRWARETEIGTAHRLVTDPIITEYVNRLAQNIAHTSDTSVPFTVKVIDSNEVNAFALPGGFLYVNTGLLTLADDEAQLAGVIGHEIAHVAARHTTRQISRGILMSQIFSAATPKKGWGRVVAHLSAMVADDMLTLKFSRGFEEEADLLGMQYMYAAGYDPGAYLRLFEELQERKRTKPNLLDRLFSSHPLTEDRIKRCQRIANNYFPDRETYRLTTSEFDDVKVRISDLHKRPGYQADEEEEQPVLRRRATDR